MTFVNGKTTPLVSVIILSFNNADKYTNKCLESLTLQSYPDVEVIVIDNVSKDDSVKKIQEWMKKYQENKLQNSQQGITFRLIINKQNNGFAAGQNQGIRESKGEYILCLNNDAWLDKDFVKNAVAILNNDKKIAAVQGKLLRYDFQNGKILDIIDTTGLVMLKNRRIINRDQGNRNSTQTDDKPGEIFGPDGASPVYRREALEDVKLPKDPKNYGPHITDQGSFEYFDESFFMYKEDVDLAWRLRLAGWKAVYAPSCRAYHGRGAGDSAAKDYVDILKERRKISGMAKYYSWKNQRLMQVKDEIPGLLLKHSFNILPKEIASWLYILIFEEPYAIRSIFEFLRQMPMAYAKRKIIMANKRISDKEMERWFE